MAAPDSTSFLRTKSRMAVGLMSLASSFCSSMLKNTKKCKIGLAGILCKSWYFYLSPLTSNLKHFKT